MPSPHQYPHLNPFAPLAPARSSVRVPVVRSPYSLTYGRGVPAPAVVTPHETAKTSGHRVSDSALVIVDPVKDSLSGGISTALARTAMSVGMSAALIVVTLRARTSATGEVSVDSLDREVLGVLDHMRAQDAEVHVIIRDTLSCAAEVCKVLYGRGVAHAAVCGTETDAAIAASAFDMHSRGIHVTVLSDLVRSPDAELSRAALRSLARVIGKENVLPSTVWSRNQAPSA